VKRIELIGVEGLPEVGAPRRPWLLISERASSLPATSSWVAQKIVSKSEGRLIKLADVTAGDDAVRIAERLIAKPDPRMVQIVLDESVRVLRSERTLITETRHGFVSANAGVDHSNVGGQDLVALLPSTLTQARGRLRSRLFELTGVEVGVIVSDTFGRPWRLGIVNVALGVAAFRR